PTARPEDICHQIEKLVCAVFDAERAAVYLREEGGGPFRRVHGPPAMPEEVAPDNALAVELERSRVPLVFAEVSHDIDLIPVVVENARRHLANPDFQRDAMAVIERTVANLRELMSQVASVARPPEVRPEPCDLAEMLDEAVTATGLSLGERDGVRLDVLCNV